MKHSSAGWFLAEFGIAFVAGVVGAMVAARRRAAPAGRHPDVDAPAQVTGRDLQPVS